MASKNRLSTKIILLVEAILLITSILFCTVSVFRARIGIRKAIQQRMLDIANCASGSVDGDALKGLTEADVGGEAYNEIFKTLAVFCVIVDHHQCNIFISFQMLSLTFILIWTVNIKIYCKTNFYKSKQTDI